jgi:hypothetical protein
VPWVSRDRERGREGGREGGREVRDEKIYIYIYRGKEGEGGRKIEMEMESAVHSAPTFPPSQTRVHATSIRWPQRNNNNNNRSRFL